jgi:hypothetical protein
LPSAFRNQSLSLAARVFAGHRVVQAEPGIHRRDLHAVEARDPEAYLLLEEGVRAPPVSNAFSTWFSSRHLPSAADCRAPGYAMFCGTLAAMGSIRPAGRFTMEI